MTSYLSDHAADQKKVFQELNEYWMECDLELCGEEMVVQMDPATESEVKQVFAERVGEMLKEIGGGPCWEELPEDEHLRLARELIQDAEICLGKQILERLPAEERRRMLTECYWSGCRMHKDLNAIKEGADRMMRWWEEAGKVPLVVLANKFKAEAGLVNSTCCSDRGGVKLTNLVGALVKCKDPGKGHQNQFRVFCRKEIQTEISFPDTSNTHYQCHTYTATEILVHAQLYLNFLTFVAVTKTSTPGQLNYMEENIQHSIMDKPTVTKLIVLSLYGQAVSIPFTWFLCTAQDRNALDLGKDYDHFKQHIQKIIDHPDLLIGPGIDATVASLNSKLWQNTHIIHKIEENYLKYPDLKGALVALFQGALAKLETFTKEFEQGSPLSNATPEEHWCAFQRLMNDRNE